MSVAPPLPATSDEQLTIKGVATAANAAALREHFGTWLRGRGVPADQMSDILVAVNEALANCVDHAYTDHTPGTMAVRADYVRARGSISVCITDHGTWRQPGPTRPHDRRGRGVALMHALSDHCTINGRRDGTTVCLDYRFRGAGLT